jgi:hypothetical protein
MQRNLPVAWVRDLLVHGNDLIAATLGRAIWVLDDVTPLRQLDANVAHADAHLFAPAPAIRVRGSQNKDTPPPADTALGMNPPTGAIIDYTLAKPAKQVVIEIREKGADGKPRVVRRFASDDKTKEPKAERYFAEAWSKPATKPSTEPGAHRIVWNLRWPRPKAVEYNYSIAAVWGENTPLAPEGALAPPGDYDVVLVVDGLESHQMLTITPDPRVQVPQADLEQALAFYRQVESELARVWRANGEVGAAHTQLDALKKKGGAAVQDPLKGAIAAFEKKLEPLRAGKGEAAPNLGAIGDALASLASDVEGADRAPTQAQAELLAQSRQRLDSAAARWQTMREGDLAALDAQLDHAGLPAIRLPSPEQIDLGSEAESKDLP